MTIPQSIHTGTLTTTGNVLLKVDNIALGYGEGAAEKRIVDALSFDVGLGEFISIVGPSGVGKTTLLRGLSGLLKPKVGQVVVGGHVVSGPHPDIAVVFQDYSRSLMPWMSTRENVAFPLQGRGAGKAERNKEAEAALEAVGLGGQGDKYPWEMSGGMQQRVAIARALAYNAKVLLMDEPFASVDAQTRFDLEDLVIDLREKLGVTIILVTHDVDEAIYLADKVIVIAEKPATVVDVIETGFGTHRDQVATKADPRFQDARARILTRLRHND
ncbi:ABC transporter ATP-binding protein [Mycetocola zhadangensis]|uniref:ABC transporter ATP-binding protein n=1 Tax=Mycetocola zhadangensis TaxID=1164595 RepID=A0A3L7IWV2_9MICO|nr:ABC transporter ATP-binding protein [Mycetocola zhadangensis]RLQ82585.1 ABC transporter ATP-binding protein [Mycetocola zhadangensis]GGF00076.1 ABC transporter [Mycetocola zhadangensis]